MAGSGRAGVAPGPFAATKKKGTKRSRRDSGCRAAARPASGNCRDGSRQVRRRRDVGGCPQVLETVGAATVLHDLKTIVVNLDRRPDRLESCGKRIAAHCTGLCYERFPATDGKRELIPACHVASSWHTARNVVFQKLRAIRKGWDDLDTYKERTLELSPGERGCASSHIRAWQYCLEQAGGGERPLLVLEDDASPTPEFGVTLSRALAALPADAHILYLGYSQAAEWKRELSPELVESVYVWTTVGYIVWPAGARLLLSKLPVDQPVDNWMACLNADGALNAYCVRPKIVRQAEAWNVNSDVAHSDEHYWGPDSDIHHSDAFYWGPEPGALTKSLFWDADPDDSDASAQSLF